MSTDDGTVVLVVRRVFAAEPEAIFDAWTRPELMARWFHSKDSWTTPKAESDLREGGAWNIEMKVDDGSIFRAFGVYREIVRPTRLVFTWHAPGDPRYETIVTLRFRKLGERSTELTLTQEGLRSDEDRSDHQTGWTGCLSVLDRFLAAP